MPILNDDAFERTRRTVLRDEMRYADQTKEGTRRVRFKGGCKGRNEVWKFKVTGTPTGGSFDVDVTVSGTQETLTFNYNWTAAQVKTELATHTKLASTDLDTAGGPFPGAEITVEFIGDFAKKKMYNSAANAPRIDDSGLTGGTSPAAFLDPMQPGSPGDGYS